MFKITAGWMGVAIDCTTKNLSYKILPQNRYTCNYASFAFSPYKPMLLTREREREREYK